MDGDGAAPRMLRTAVKVTPVSEFVSLVFVCLSCSLSLAEAGRQDLLKNIRIDLHGFSIVFEMSKSVEVSCRVDSIRLSYRDEVSTSGALWWREPQVLSNALNFSIVDRSTGGIVGSSQLSNFDINVTGFVSDRKPVDHRFTLYRLTLPSLFREFSRATQQPESLWSVQEIQIFFSPNYTRELGTGWFSSLVSPRSDRGFVASKNVTFIASSTPTYNFDELYQLHCADKPNKEAGLTVRSEPDPCNRRLESGEICAKDVIYAGTVSDRRLFIELGTGLRRNWDNANRSCETSELGGYKDWRLPTEKELRFLMSSQDRLPEGTGLTPKDSSSQFRWENAFWTSEESLGLKVAVALNGTKLFSSRTNRNLYRCVRSI